MADLPSRSGHLQVDAVDTAVADLSSVPAWMTARRARGSSEAAADQELDIEFESVPEAEHPGSTDPLQGSNLELDQPDEPVTERVTAVPPPLPSGRRSKGAQRVNFVSAESERAAPVDNSLTANILRWTRSAMMTGLLVSLLVHISILSVLGVVVVGAASLDPGFADVVSELGDPNGDPNGVDDLEFDSAMPSSPDPGHDAPPLEFPDVSQMMHEGGPLARQGDAIRGMAGGEGTGEGFGGGNGTGIGVPSLNVPKYAVTRGSFSVWTDPKDPIPGIAYEIVIQFRLPPTVKRYKGSDLSGVVIGTDDYKQPIRLGTRTYPVEDGSVQIRIRVPGADRLVRDTIRVESKLLKEKQVIEIEF